MPPTQSPARAENSGSGGGSEADPPPEREISSRRGEARTPGADDMLSLRRGEGSGMSERRPGLGRIGAVAIVVIGAFVVVLLVWHRAFGAA